VRGPTRSLCRGQPWRDLVGGMALRQLPRIVDLSCVPGPVQAGAEVVEAHDEHCATMVADDDAAWGTLGQWCKCKDVGRPQCEGAARSNAVVNA
jgi:hypothetical protein